MGVEVQSKVIKWFLSTQSRNVLFPQSRNVLFEGRVERWFKGEYSSGVALLGSSKRCDELARSNGGKPSVNRALRGTSEGFAVLPAYLVNFEREV